MSSIYAWLLKVVAFVGNLFKTIWVFVAAFTSIAVMYILLISVEQGIDVVIHAGEYPERGILAIVAIIIWSYLLWYSCRTLSYVRQDNDDRQYLENYIKYSIPTNFYQHVPRFLAYNCFVCMQIAIFSLPTFYAWSILFVFSAVMLHGGFYILLHKYLKARSRIRRRNFGIACLVAIVGYGGFLLLDLIVCGYDLKLKVFDSEPDRHEFWLRLIALVLFLFQIAAIKYFVWRRAQIDAELSKKGSGLTYYHKNLTGVPQKRRFIEWFKHPRFCVAERPYFRIFNAVSATAGALYITVIFWIAFANYMGPLALSILSISILTGLANLIQVVSIRIRFSMFFIFYMIAFVVGLVFRDPYRVRLEPDGDRKHFNMRPTPRAYMTKWFDKRLEKIALNEKYRAGLDTFDVYIILSNGGASRAGKWTTSVLSGLQDISRKRNPHDKFSDHILAIAGASGGTVGNCAFYSLLKAELDKDPLFMDTIDYSGHTNRFFNSDFLTFTLGRFLGPDIIRHIFPIDMDDRAASLARLLSHSQDPLLNKYFDANLTQVFDYSGELPVLYITSTKVDDGMPGLISSVQLTKNSKRNDILTIIDNLTDEEKGSNLKLSTAAILSSRFPYVSPAGKIGKNYYVDGGYFDNSGAGTVLELLGELSKLFEENQNYQGKFSFHILHNSNAEVFPKMTKPIHPLKNDLLAPVLTLAGMQGASTSISNATLTQNFLLFSKDTIHSIIDYNLYDKSFPQDSTKPKFEEGYPMSWVISDYQLDRMDSALRMANSDKLRDFYFFIAKEDTVRPQKRPACCTWGSVK